MSTKIELEAGKYYLVDAASNWITKKDAAYLAKEGLVVYYASSTGRKSDYQWFKLSLQEVVRIISATELSADANIPLRSNHIITACQELDRVFEMGVSSRHPVVSNIFNYLDHEDTDLATQVMQALARDLYNRGFEAFRRSDMLDIYSKLNFALKLGAGAKATSDMYWPAFTGMGYIIKDKQNRVLLDGSKQCVFMMPGLKPRNVVALSSSVKDEVYGSLFSTFK